jgi:hypothetical protein
MRIYWFCASALATTFFFAFPVGAQQIVAYGYVDGRQLSKDKEYTIDSTPNHFQLIPPSVPITVKYEGVGAYGLLLSDQPQ